MLFLWQHLDLASKLPYIITRNGFLLTVSPRFIFCLTQRSISANEFTGFVPNHNLKVYVFLKIGCAKAISY